MVQWAPALAEGSPPTDTSMTSAWIRVNLGGCRMGKDEGGQCRWKPCFTAVSSVVFSVRKGAVGVRNGRGKCVRRGKKRVRRKGWGVRGLSS